MKSLAAQQVSFFMLCGLLVLDQPGRITPQPIVAPPSGVYNCPETVSVTDARPGAAIFYTMDGSTPTSSSSKYTGPFVVNSTKKVQAIAQAPGAKVSTVATAVYTCATNLTVAGFAVLMQQQFNLPQPANPVHFADLAPGDPNYAAAQAITPFLHRQVLCHGCVLSANFGPNQPLQRVAAAVFFVSVLMAQNKVQLLSAKDADGVLASAPDTNILPLVARRYVATALKYGVLPLRAGNTIQSMKPFSPTEMTTVLQTMQNQFNLRPAPLR